MSDSNEEPSPKKSRLIVTPDEAAAEGVTLNLITSKDQHRTKGGVLWVVMDKHCTTVAQWPGQTKPFHTKSKKFAESVAQQMGGVAVTHREALELVATSPCNFPKDSKMYNPDPAAAKIRMSQGRG